MKVNNERSSTRKETNQKDKHFLLDMYTAEELRLYKHFQRWGNVEDQHEGWVTDLEDFNCI